MITLPVLLHVVYASAGSTTQGLRALLLPIGIITCSADIPEAASLVYGAPGTGGGLVVLAEVLAAEGAGAGANVGVRGGHVGEGGGLVRVEAVLVRNLMRVRCLLVVLIFTGHVAANVLGADIADGSAKERRVIIIGIGRTHSALLVLVVITAKEGILFRIVYLR